MIIFAHVLHEFVIEVFGSRCSGFGLFVKLLVAFVGSEGIHDDKKRDEDIPLLLERALGLLSFVGLRMGVLSTRKRLNESVKD